MLRHISKLRLGAFVAPSFLNVRNNPDGSVDEVMEPSNGKLPDSSTFSVENLVKAKIPLKRVKTKIVRSKRPEVLGEQLETELEQTQNQQTNE